MANSYEKGKQIALLFGRNRVSEMRSIFAKRYDQSLIFCLKIKIRNTANYYEKGKP